MDKSDLLKRRAGIAIPIFSLNEPGNWGIGEFKDLYPLVDWMASFGQTILQVLPFNEMAPGVNSPYSALSIFAIDPVYVSIHEEPSDKIKKEIAKCAKGPIPYGRIRDIKLKCLEPDYEIFKKKIPASYKEFEEVNMWWLHDYALFRLLKEKNKWYSWTHWEPKYRDRDKAALDELAGSDSERLMFFKFVQWVAWEQWKEFKEYAESKGVFLKGDVPFAPNDESDIAWVHREIIDPNFTLGAPPDAFSAKGQKWGLPVYHIGRLEERNFDYWRVRARWADRLFHYYRIDHVVGCYRMYAFPENKNDKSRFIPGQENEQLAIGERIIKIIIDESRNSHPMAEDLGVVPDFVRASLKQLDVPGYKVFRWERYWNTPEQHYIDTKDYPDGSIATTSTHDTETLSVWWNSIPVTEKKELINLLGVEGETGSLKFDRKIHLGILKAMYTSGSSFVIIPIQDIFGWDDLINVPGTYNKKNWSYRLPGSIKEIANNKSNKACTDKIGVYVEDSGRENAVCAKV